MDALWWTLGIIALAFYTLWAAGAFKNKPKQPPAEGKK